MTHVIRPLLVLLMMSGSMLFPTRAMAQISPGPLARPHAQLEGTANCVKCHQLSRGASMADACLGCHRDLKAVIDQKRGYHARLSPARRNNCASCHPDHAGRDFAMIEWPDGSPSRFDHAQASWPLEGKHKEAKCASCHELAKRQTPLAAISPKRTERPWVGLETTCKGCHAQDDAHDGQFAPGCQSCHDANDWKQAPHFDHERSRYPLTGKHADVTCTQCHRADGVARRSTAAESVVRYRPLPFARCSNCHNDPHGGRIRESCTTCHNTSGWATVDRQSFDHAVTRYPLTGRHARVACVSCHGANNTKPLPAFATCASCHSDVHRGEASQKRDCASCHTTANFTSATFTVGNHASTTYPLEGKHRTATCRSCHTAVAAPGASGATATRYVRLRMSYSTCTACHVNSHGAQAAVTNAAQGCASCHSVAGFVPSTVSVASHSRFQFALDGKHAKATCSACHGTQRPGLPALSAPPGAVPFVLATGETRCEQCHTDSHAGRYGAKSQSGLSCQTCHNTTSFRPSTMGVDTHGKVAMKLEGAHAATTCTDCHRELLRPAGGSTLVRGGKAIAALPFDAGRGANCAACHTDVHDRQFALGPAKGACNACHAVDRFAGASRFDHSRDTKFPLAGGHATVTCAQCHAIPAGATFPAQVPESARRRYAGTPRACESCHTGKRSGV